MTPALLGSHNTASRLATQLKAFSLAKLKRYSDQTKDKVPVLALSVRCDTCGAGSV